MLTNKVIYIGVKYSVFYFINQVKMRCWISAEVTEIHLDAIIGCGDSAAKQFERKRRIFGVPTEKTQGEPLSGKNELAEFLSESKRTTRSGGLAHHVKREERTRDHLLSVKQVGKFWA